MPPWPLSQEHSDPCSVQKFLSPGLRLTCRPSTTTWLKAPGAPKKLKSKKDISSNDLVRHSLKFILHLLQEGLHLRK